MITGIILAAVIVGATGCLIGFFLCFSAEKFKVEVDPREAAIREALPGNNCGGCGFPVPTPFFIRTLRASRWSV